MLACFSIGLAVALSMTDDQGQVDNPVTRSPVHAEMLALMDNPDPKLMSPWFKLAIFFDCDPYPIYRACDHLQQRWILGKYIDKLHRRREAIEQRLKAIGPPRYLPPGPPR